MTAINLSRNNLHNCHIWQERERTVGVWPGTRARGIKAESMSALGAINLIGSGIAWR